MSVISQHTPTSNHQSTSFSILDLKSQAFRLPVSKAAQILLSELLSWSGEKGYCWWGVSSIARDLNWSNATVWRKATELKNSGLLEVIPRPGRSNYWVPLPGPLKMKRLQNELTPLAVSRGPLEKKIEKEEKRCTVEKVGTSTYETPPSPKDQNDNVINLEFIENQTSQTSSNHQHQIYPTSKMSREPVSIPSPVPKPPEQSSSTRENSINCKNSNNPPINIELVHEIEELTGDTKSRRCWIKIVKTVPENTIYAGLSSLRTAMSEGIIKNPGSYMVGTIKTYYPDLFCPKKHYQKSLTQPEPVVVHQKLVRDNFFRPEDTIVPASPEVVASAISKIKLLLNSPTEGSFSCG